MPQELILEIKISPSNDKPVFLTVDPVWNNGTRSVITFHPKNTEAAQWAIMTPIPRMKHDGRGFAKNLFDHDAWRHSEDALWDSMMETVTFPDDEEFDALFGIDAECDYVPFKLTEQFHQEMNQRKTQKEDNSNSVGSLTTFNQPGQIGEEDCHEDDDKCDLIPEGSEANGTCPTESNEFNDEVHIERVEQSKETAEVSLGSAVCVNDTPKVATIPAEGEGKSTARHKKNDNYLE